MYAKTQWELLDEELTSLMEIDDFRKDGEGGFQEAPHGPYSPGSGNAGHCNSDRAMTTERAEHADHSSLMAADGTAKEVLKFAKHPSIGIPIAPPRVDSSKGPKPVK